MEWERQAESTLNAWAAAAQAGDEAARLALLRQFEPLIRSTAAWLWRGVLRSQLTNIYERADLIQETQRLFLELVQEHTLRRGRSFTPFIVTMLRWRARNFLSQAQRRRMAGRRQRIDDEETLEKVAQLGHALFPDPAAVAIERTVLLDAMRQLTLRQRRLLYLHYWHDVPVVQLASAWGVSQQAIRQALQRAHRSLRRHLVADTAPQASPAPAGLVLDIIEDKPAHLDTGINDVHATAPAVAPAQPPPRSPQPANGH